MTPAPMATRPLAPNAIPVMNEIKRELSKLNSGYLAESFRQAGTLDAIISSNAAEVTANTNIIENNIINPFDSWFFMRLEIVKTGAGII